jgi:hypothetical protein
MKAVPTFRSEECYSSDQLQKAPKSRLQEENNITLKDEC